jgi:hypothetical protein
MQLLPCCSSAFRYFALDDGVRLIQNPWLWKYAYACEGGSHQCQLLSSKLPEELQAEKLKMIKEEVVDEMTVKEQHETVQEYLRRKNKGTPRTG